MWIRGMRISGAYNFAEQNERWIGELIFFHDRIERNILAVMTELAIGHVEYDSVINLRPVGVVWQEHKICVWVNEFFDEPRAGNSIDFNFLAGNPFHTLRSYLWQPGFGTRSLLRYFTARTKSLPGLLPIALVKVSVVSLWKPARHCRS